MLIWIVRKQLHSQYITLTNFDLHTYNVGKDHYECVLGVGILGLHYDKLDLDVDVCSANKREIQMMCSMYSL